MVWGVVDVDFSSCINALVKLILNSNEARTL